MTKKKYAVLVFLLSFVLLVAEAQAKSSVWKISKGSEYFYVGATIHFLSEGDYPLPEEFLAAYSDADVLFFETDMVSVQSLEFQSKFMAAMMYSDDRTLSTELTPESYSNLQEFLEVRKIPVASFSKFQPWGASLMISVIEYQRLGMMPQYGVDIFFHKLAQDEGKAIMWLETPEEQLTAFESMGSIDPDVMVDYTIRDLAQLPEFIKVMKSSWRVGDVTSLSSNKWVMQMEEEFPMVYKVLITDRNQKWMNAIPALINDSERELVLVGAMHLSGKEGLLELLRAKGFIVEQL